MHVDSCLVNWYNLWYTQGVKRSDWCFALAYADILHNAKEHENKKVKRKENNIWFGIFFFLWFPFHYITAFFINDWYVYWYIHIWVTALDSENLTCWFWVDEFGFTMERDSIKNSVSSIQRDISYTVLPDSSLQSIQCLFRELRTNQAMKMSEKKRPD